MEENIQKFEIKIDPIDFHKGLREQMTDFESTVKNEVLSGVHLAKKIEKKLASRFCHCCFFGKVAGHVMGEPLCEECARELYGITGIHGEYDKEKMEDLHHQLWYRKQKALPIFEAYLSAEMRYWQSELKNEVESGTEEEG